MDPLDLLDKLASTKTIKRENFVRLISTTALSFRFRQSSCRLASGHMAHPEELKPFLFPSRVKQKLHRHKGISLSLDGRDTIDRLQLGQEGFFGRELRTLPRFPFFSGREGRDDLEVQATAANHAVDTLHAVDRLQFLQDVVQGALGELQRLLVVVGRPLATPLPGDGVEFYAVHNCYHGSCRSENRRRTDCSRSSEGEGLIQRSDTLDHCALCSVVVVIISAANDAEAKCKIRFTFV